MFWKKKPYHKEKTRIIRNRLNSYQKFFPAGASGRNTVVFISSIKDLSDNKACPWGEFGVPVVWNFFCVKIKKVLLGCLFFFWWQKKNTWSSLWNLIICSQTYQATYLLAFFFSWGGGKRGLPPASPPQTF